MADCGEITITAPTVTCESDLQTAFTEMAQQNQSAIDQLKACIESYELPECDICVLKDDLVDCPLDCDMIDFSGIQWGDEGDVCQLPYPNNLVYRTGTETIDDLDGQDSDWPLFTFTFDTPFDTQCLGVFISFTAIGGGTFNVARAYDALTHGLTSDSDMTNDEAMREIRGDIAGGFDQNVIAALEQVLRRKVDVPVREPVSV